MELRDDDNQNCYWIQEDNECVTFSCGAIEDEEECELLDPEYFCEWKVFTDTALGEQLNPPSGDLPLCYSQCPKNLDIVFIVDTSASVVNSDPENPELFGDFIETIMDTWWKMQEQLGLITEFALVDFNTDVRTQWNLNTGFVTFVFCLNLLFDLLYVFQMGFREIFERNR